MCAKVACVVLWTTLYVTQSQTQKLECSCAQQADFWQYSFPPPMVDAKDHCSIAWTCKTKECAYYDYEEQEKAALHFKAPVVNASFAAIVVKSPVELVKVSVECPKTNFVVKDLPCLCKKSSPSPPSTYTNQDRNSQETQEKTRNIIIAVVIFIIFTVLCSVAVVCIIRCKKKHTTNGQGTGNGQVASQQVQFIN